MAGELAYEDGAASVLLVHLVGSRIAAMIRPRVDASWRSDPGAWGRSASSAVTTITNEVLYQLSYAGARPL